MEGCYSKEEYEFKSNRIDLAQKLSPCGEERRLRRSSSLLGVASGARWGTFVESIDRSCSLPTEAQRLRRVAASSINVNTPPLHQLKPHPNAFQDPRHSTDGVGSYKQTSTKPENDSMVSQKTMAKEFPPRTADSKPQDNPAKKPKLGNYCSLKGDVMEILRQMPSVTTTGDGPNGKRIEGFLYKYRSGQVCIVCVCHGNFLTPAEFVMHAGGKEVANPMKLITVYSNSF